MKIREIMTSDVSTAELSTTIEEIATIMKHEDVGAVPVVDDDELVGIVTDRDIVVRCIAEGRDATETCAEDVIGGDLATVSPDDDVQHAADLMARRQVRRLPVVDDGHLIGMVSLGDIAVKQDDEITSGETLEEVSRGVKGSRPQRRTATQAANIHAPHATGTRGEGSGRQGRMEQQPGRSEHVSPQGRASSTRGQEEPRAQRTGRSDQGISNTSAKEEVERQNRIVPIRSESKAKGAARNPRRRVS